MSDSFLLLNKMLTGGKTDLPRYTDMFVSPGNNEPEETKEEVFSRFDKLRRK